MRTLRILALSLVLLGSGVAVANATTIDGQYDSTGALAGGATTNLTVVGRGGVPGSGVGSVALNVTVVNPTVAGFLTVWPAGAPHPLASNLNFTPGQTVPNMVIVPVGANGQISVYASSGTVDVIVDVLGWFPTGPGFNGLTPARLMDTRVPTPPPTVPTTTTPAPAVLTFSAGTHLVGSDIPAGRYIATNAGSGCYWERLSGLSGSIDEIIANDFQGFAGPAIVDVAATDKAFKFQGGCGKFKTYSAPASTTSTIGPGTHVIGSEIPAGTYSTAAVNGCYWARLATFSGQTADILANDFVSGPGQQIVTITSSDTGFTTNDKCGTWAPT